MCNLDYHKDSCKTYIEQTKLLVTLASAFVIAPAAAFTLVPLANPHLLIWSELFFVLSVIFGYVVLATISGSQAINSYNVYRSSTRNSSIIQIIAYIAGLVLFVIMIKNTSAYEKIKGSRQLIIYTNEKLFELKLNQALLIFNADTIRTDIFLDSLNKRKETNRIYIIEKK